LDQKVQPIDGRRTIYKKLSLEPDEAVGDQKRIRLRPVGLGNVPWGANAPVDLYQHRGKKLSLLFRENQGLSFESYAEISQSTDRLYYNKEVEVDWKSLIESNLTAILDSPMPIEGKAAVAYGSASRQTEQIFEDFDEEAVEMANTTVGAINTLMKEPEAIESFFQLTVHDYYTYTHSVHVYIYASMLTRALIGDENDAFLQDLGVGYLLHDIGKKDIDPEILNKEGELNDEEWVIIKTHPDRGHELIKEVTGNISDEVSQIVLQHHEKYDGSGYPKGLKEDGIGRYGKICCIADVYDALTTKRSYKDALSKTAALTIMRDDPGHFEEELLAKFIQLAAPFLV
jgi:HD-GYP domain-containing protein (c-di-GMP phosphodiesterase class II)